MKIKTFLCALALALMSLMGTAHAGWCWGNGWGCGWRGGWCGPGWGGWCGPRWGGWGWGGPTINLGYWGPPAVVPVYTTPVYQPVAAPVYQPVYVTKVTPAPPVVANSFVAQVQARLANLGYYRGPVDGSFGPRTAEALQTYQFDYGLPVTGRLDPRTIKSLRV